MTEWDWLRIVYLAMVLGLLIGTVRTHQIGGRRMLVMALAWLGIFMVVAGIAASIRERTVDAPLPPPSPEGGSILT